MLKELFDTKKILVLFTKLIFNVDLPKFVISMFFSNIPSTTTVPNSKLVVDILKIGIEP
mgnify:CR=1 FL=1